MKIKKGDNVVVLAGKDKGKKGKVLEVFPKDGTLIVERVNIVKRHQRASRNFQGGIIEKAATLQIAKVMLVCPKCSEPTRVKRNKDGRICSRCQETVEKVK
ncbi:MAG: 50S ribosomal protein L24 [bacterium]|nr:50S ribosomal protein L24 [Candidatus Margulisiibacteriota bacterium]